MFDIVLNPIEVEKSILLVEDEAIIALYKARELKRYGYNSVQHQKDRTPCFS
jgi:hypothetical protein